MKLKFYKYQGAGNDFVMVDGRDATTPKLSEKVIEKLCHRRFGVGADGLMILTDGNEGEDFYMNFYNSDGKEGTMCGNGGRCISLFADDLGIGGAEKIFSASDGVHKTYVKDGIVELGMIDVENVFTIDEGFITDTGSPHVVIYDEGYDQARARRLRQIYDSNINFIEISDERIDIRTFERGVEDETWACGTGSVASALARSVLENKMGDIEYKVKAKGGDLKVRFTRTESGFTNIVLIGGAKRVFEGEIEL